MRKKRDLELLYELGCFRYSQRTWNRFLNPDFQNNSEHSFRVAFIALLLAKYEKIKDTEKVLKMALIHDLPESRCGDVDYLSRQYVTRDEKQAVQDIFKNTELEEELVALWIEFEEKRSLEAKIVKDADNLDVDLELEEQASRGSDHKKIWESSRKNAADIRFFTKSAKKLYKKLRKSNPHSWHLNGRNRFNAGDWKKKV